MEISTIQNKNMKQVTITETIIRKYVVDYVEASSDDEAAKLAEDLIVNYEECEEVCLKEERVIDKCVSVKNYS